MLDTTALPDYAATREGWRFFRGNPNEVDLRCNSNEVVLYNMRSGDLVEVDLKSGRMKITKTPLMPPGPDFLITGFALTESGQIFASFLDRSDVKKAVTGLFRLDRCRLVAMWCPFPELSGFI